MNKERKETNMFSNDDVKAAIDDFSNALKLDKRKEESHVKIGNAAAKLLEIFLINQAEVAHSLQAIEMNTRRGQ